jgi:hypothetical protein
MKKTKKLAYGEKAAQVMDLINRSAKTNTEIGKIVGCHPNYVYAIRKKMLRAVEEPLKLTEAMEAPKETGVDAILTERGSRYGNFLDHARISQRLKAAAHQFAAEQGKHFDADQAEALDMIFHKLGRILNGDPNYADSWVDIAGYATLVVDRLEGKVR